VTRRTRAGLLAVASSLVLAAPAHAINCREVFSKIDQADPLAPFVVGDSVTVPAGEYLGEQGFAVNAVACRTFAQGLAVMSARRLPDLVVVALGSNGAVSGAELERALDLVGPFGQLALVLPKELGGGADPDARTMRAFEEAHADQVTTIDWPGYSAGHGNWFQPDGLHLTGDGAIGFAQMIGEAVELAPPERIEPPPEPKRKPARRSTSEPAGETAVTALWSAVGSTIAAVVAPGVRLLARVFDGEPAPSDL
jgi:hypothetical protein